MDSEIGNRIDKIISHYQENRSSFSTKIGLSNNVTIGRIINENRSPSFEILNKIATTYPEINYQWLLTGNGSMIQNKPLVSNSSKGVPYYEGIEATGSILTSFNDIKENPSFYISYPHFDDCTAYLPMAGDSMYPKYCAGEIIAVKQIYNFDIIQWGEAYMIVTDSEANDLRTIKLLFPHKDEDKIILRASNPNFAGDTIIPKKNIVSLFLVKGKITRNQL